jgi:hypothetical protein
MSAPDIEQLRRGCPTCPANPIFADLTPSIPIDRGNDQRRGPTEMNDDNA